MINHCVLSVPPAKRPIHSPAPSISIPSQSSVHQAGLSLLEIVITLALGGIIILALASTAATTIRSHHLFHEVLLARQMESLLDAELAKFTRDYDSHPLALPPVIHDPGSIRLRDGSLNAVMQSAGEHIRPHANSQSVSFIAPLWHSALRVISSEDPSHSTIHACARGSTPISLSGVDTVIALGIDGMWQAALRGISSTGVSGCYQLTLAPTHGIFLPRLPQEALPLVRLIIPIGEEYTLYLSQAGELRYLGHAGERNIENQPIVSKLSSFIATASPAPLPGVAAITLEAGVKNRTVRRSGVSHFEKSSYVDLLVNAL
jgi:hypothetical protein